ncbi:hypothetical protein CSV61_02155 [Sporosarcina sp. P3]|uniref:GAF domain-containing protein n=1 Tax=Sporosarcina sp. P3 TaxID=2048245 RepID=UPI000C167421|nr:GAF domain-containing protein [Sporosarcina sp. P3]PID22470.1 hypothetical protein CSV61_02155 [Sporosarcina sp. P3]
MEHFITQWFLRIPDWVITITSVIFIFIFIIISRTLWLAVKRYSDAIGRENRLISLQDDVGDLRAEINAQRNKALQYQNVTINARSFVNSLNNLVRDQSDGYVFFIQRIVEAIAADIKSSGSERHRCGFWLKEGDDEEALTLYTGSAGFPDTYISNRKLDIHDSIAGRAFRKKQIINLSDVTTDSDWSSADSSGTYKALICIPVDVYGILTIDAREPMDENIQLIGELYAVIIEGVLNEMVRDLQSDINGHETNASSNEAASDVEY